MQTKQLSSKHSWLRYGLAGVIFCLCFVLTIVAFKATQTFETRRIETETERLIRSQMANLQRGLDLTRESIQALGAYIGASALIRQEGFKQYAEEMRERLIKIEAKIQKQLDKEAGKHIRFNASTRIEGGFKNLNIPFSVRL